MAAQNKSLDDQLIIMQIDNLFGQVKLKNEYNLAIKKAKGQISDFYNLVEQHENIIKSKKGDVKRKSDLAKFQNAMRDYFVKNKLPLDLDRKVPNESQLKNNPNLQTALYFQAYALSQFNFDLNGNLNLKVQDSEEIKTLAKKQLDALCAVGFLPAFKLRADPGLEIDVDLQRKINYQGARAGNLSCMARVGQYYLSYLTGTASSKEVSKYSFPEGENPGKVLAGLREAKVAGDVEAISYVGNFVSNAFNAMPALFQEGEGKTVNELQKARLIEMAEIAMVISGDKNVNQSMVALLKLEKNDQLSMKEKLQQAKEITSDAKMFMNDPKAFHNYKALVAPVEKLIKESNSLEENNLLLTLKNKLIAQANAEGGKVNFAKAFQEASTGYPHNANEIYDRIKTSGLIEASYIYNLVKNPSDVNFDYLVGIMKEQGASFNVRISTHVAQFQDPDRVNAYNALVEKYSRSVANDFIENPGKTENEDRMVRLLTSVPKNTAISKRIEKTILDKMTSTDPVKIKTASNFLKEREKSGNEMDVIASNIFGKLSDRAKDSGTRPKSIVRSYYKTATKTALQAIRPVSENPSKPKKK